MAKSSASQTEETRVLGSPTKDILAQEETLQEIRDILGPGGDPTNVIVEPTTGINDGNQVVAVAGTRVQLSIVSVTCKGVIIQSLSTNTGLIFIGGITVSNANGVELTAGESVSVDIDDLNKIYLDASVNGEGIKFTVVT